MGKMKELAMELEEIPTVYLMETLKRRFEEHTYPLQVTDGEIHSLCTVLEVELINRMAAQHTGDN